MRRTEHRMILNRETCDRISDLIMAFCKKEKAENQDAVRHRLSAEECLLEWIDAGFEGQEVVLRTEHRLLAAFFSLEMAGDSLNPYENTSPDEYGHFFDNVFVSLNLKPEYSYKNGKNLLRFRLRRRSPGQLQTLGLVVASAAIVGVLGMTLLPDALRQLLLANIVTPLYGVFFKLLGCVAAPMIFLSVLWGILGVGDISSLGRIGRKMLLGFIRDTFAVTAFCVVFFPFLGPGLAGSSSQGTNMSDLMKLILGIFPPNIVEPFATGNMLQVVFLSFAIGIGLLYLGDQANSIKAAIGQANLLVRFLMESLGKLVPPVIFLVILNLIWSGSLSVLGTLWKYVLALAAALILIGTAMVLWTCFRQKVRVPILLKKALPAFLIGISTASSAAAFNTSMATCNEQYGIDSSVSSFGLPLGMVMHKPSIATFYILLVFYSAGACRIACTPAWIIMSVLVCAVLAIATPPVVGGGVIAISIIFAHMNIPEEALAAALTIDMLTDFPVTAFGIFSLQMNLINLASRLGLLDKDKLRS